MKHIIKEGTALSAEDFDTWYNVLGGDEELGYEIVALFINRSDAEMFIAHKEVSHEV